MKFGRILWRLKNYVRVYWLLFKDPRTPKISKLMVILAVVYLVSPFDLIPDFIPFAGWIDEIIIVPLVFYLATLFIPKHVVEDNKKLAKKEKLGERSKKFKDGEVQEGVIVD